MFLVSASLLIFVVPFLKPPGSDSMDVGISGSTASSPVDDNISVSSCSSGGESSDEASLTIHNGSSPNVDRLINSQKSSKLSRNLDDANRGRSRNEEFGTSLVMKPCFF